MNRNSSPSHTKGQNHKSKTAFIESNGVQKPSAQYNDVSKSINIFTMKIQGKQRQPSQSRVKTNNDFSKSKRISIRKNTSGQSYQVDISTIKKKGSRTSLQLIDYGYNQDCCFEKYCQPTCSTLNQSNLLIDKYLRKKLMIQQKNRYSLQKDVMKSLLEQLYEKIRILTQQKDSLQIAHNKYYQYFRQMKLNKQFDAPQIELDKTQNADLKILNLEKKVQTLNFIIRQYRAQNHQQIREFQKKINQYRPNIQHELTKELMVSNQKLSELQAQLNYFKRQCILQAKKTRNQQINWQELVSKRKIHFDELQITKNDLETLNTQFNTVNKNYQQCLHKLQQIPQIQSQLQIQKQKNKNLTEQLAKIYRQMQVKQLRLDQLSRQCQEFNYQLATLKNLQSKIQLKDSAIKRNSVQISKLQMQNLTLKTKIQAFKQKYQCKNFPQNSLKKKIQTIANKVDESNERIKECFNDFDLDLFSTDKFTEKKSFLKYLIDANMNHYQQILQEYQLQLTLVSNECSQWNTTVIKLIDEKQLKNSLIKDITKQMQFIDKKKNRCVETQLKIEVDSKCNSCVQWMAHWGQINNLFDQIHLMIIKILDIC